MNKKLAIITVAYNNYDVLKDFLASLEVQTDTAFQLYIADLSLERQDIHTSLDITVIPATNKGYAHGVNVGLEQAQKDGIEQFCVINDDTFFEKSFVQDVRTSLDKNPGSIIGGKIFYAKGHEYHKARYSSEQLGNVLWYAGGSVDWAHAITHHRGVDEVDLGQYNEFDETDFITGCLMCFDKMVVEKIGLWDTSYFLYFEDSDYTEQAKKKGIKLFYDPSIVIWHKNAQSTGGAGSKLHERFQKNSRVRFAMRYAPFRTKLHIIKNYFLSY